jgi:hypothetical protein
MAGSVIRSKDNKPKAKPGPVLNPKQRAQAQQQQAQAKKQLGKSK